MTSCWTICEDKAGMAVQCRALAEALAMPTVAKTIAPRVPWKWLPSGLWLESAMLRQRGGRLAPPWPDLVISCGRHAAGAAAAIRRVSAGRSFVVHIQNPRQPLARFDLVVAPRHDRLDGGNVIATLGSLHGLHPELLAAEAAQLDRHVAGLPRPYVAVLFGGTNRHFRCGVSEAESLAARLRTACRQLGGSLLVTPSRRTSREALEALGRGLAGVPHKLWNRTGANPYRAYLGLADHVVVTCDSVNMTTEACATGRPVHVVKLPGGSARFEAFHAGLEAAGMTRPFDGELTEWRYEPLLETPRVAAEIKARMAAWREAESTGPVRAA